MPNTKFVYQLIFASIKNRFERQLAVDQDSCTAPDYQTPFQSKEDAVKRLIR